MQGSKKATITLFLKKKEKAILQTHTAQADSIREELHNKNPQEIQKERAAEEKAAKEAAFKAKNEQKADRHVALRGLTLKGGQEERQQKRL